ncbi:MAG: sulfatase-like hydrolase/transferase, partial [Polyangiales bacterium]
DHSLTFGRVASLAARRWPPPPLDLGEGGVDPLVEDETRTLDASGRDVLLVTIDALRADHCGTYGYGRPTTPALDALAREGVVFEHAYTPAPHTSYAVSSLMTGKYLRPIMALEAVAGGARRLDETWALLLRGYGFRTAAFYPPAVFFVDAERFTNLAQRGLDFEYSKIEFAAPSLRVAQLTGWLSTTPRDKPVFAWVHLFEPHEPYVIHPDHDFGSTELDRYDSEIAAADAGLAGLVQAFRAARPNAIVIVTADHGEAFGEHGARYHGTTVFEEQVRVPLVISAPGLVAVRRVARPVQLVDLLPTILSAYGIPRPPRVRGRDLGNLLGAAEPPPGEGIAFAEVDDAAMLAEGDHRLVCRRKSSTCALYDVAKDPGELHPVASMDERLAAMRRTMGALIAASAKLEGFAAGDASSWPDSLRRALAGEGDAAIDVAPLLDDVDVGFRRRAAEALARLGRPETAVHVARAVVHEIDEPTRRWLTIARVRTVLAPDETPVSPDVEDALVGLVASNEKDVAHYAALAVGEGVARRTIDVSIAAQVRAFVVLVDWLPRARVDAELARSILAALVTLHTRDLAPRATKPLLEALDDIRLRADAAATLGALGDPSAIPGLVAQLRRERHSDARAAECLALSRVAERSVAMPWFAWILGVPEPAPGGARALTEALAPGAAPPWAAVHKVKATRVKAELAVLPGTHHRLVVDVPRGTSVRMRLWGAATVETIAGDAGAIFELGEKLRANGALLAGFEVETTSAPIGVVALVRLVDDLPPPKPD